MENKEVERILKNSYDIGNCYVKESISIAFTYIEQLEKENKYLRKQAFNNDSLHIRICELERCIERLQGNKKNREVRIRNIEKENAELTKQLQAKDKALDKACGKIEYETQENDDCPNVAYGFVSKCCNEDFCEGSNKECWKEWCENGIY